MILRGVLLSFLVFVSTVVVCSIICLLNLTCKLCGKNLSSKYPHEIAIFWAKMIFYLTPGWRFRISSGSHIPESESVCVYVANHSSTVDVLAIYLLGVQFRWLAKKELFNIPLVGWGMTMCGYIPVDRGSSSGRKRSYKLLGDCIDKGFSTLFFPEGTRSLEVGFKPFKKGAFRLAAEKSVPVVPICLSGAKDLMSVGTFIPKSGILEIKVLSPTMKRVGESVDEFTKRVEKSMREELY